MNAYHVRSSTEIYNGRVVRLRVDEVEMPGGGVARREVAGHPGGVGIIALDDGERVCLIRQYRHPVQQWLLEVPAGLRDVPGEPADHAARRELEEEADVRAGQIEHLCSLAVSPGFTDEIVEIYLARELTAVAAGAREDEEADIEVQWTDLDEAVAMIDRGAIIQAIAVAGIQAAMRRVRRGP